MASVEPVDQDFTSTLNPREILLYLNELGIRNVNSEMLKEFIKDLKKLIRLDQQRKDYEMKLRYEERALRTGPERLHSCSTFSSRSKSVGSIERRKPLANIIPVKDNQHNIMTINVCKRASTAKQCAKSKKVRPSTAIPCSSKSTAKVPSSTRSTVNVPSSTRSTVTAPCSSKTSKNLIKVPIPEKQKKSDPVTLYHYYNSLWEKYKSNLPGENSWADLRWSVRERLLGVVQEQPRPVCAQSKETLAKRREGWTE